MGVTIISICVGVPIIHRYGGYIKIRLYTRFRFYPWDKVDENIEDKEYDEFVLYFSDDWPWVCDTLMPKLEDEHGFKLCVHDRDFVPGSYIEDNITKAIDWSRRTIVVVTPEYTNSYWCNVEFLQATQKALNERVDFLIVVLLRKVNDKDLAGKDVRPLKLHMKTKTFVSVEDKRFWKKLVYALPTVSIKDAEDEEANVNDDMGPLVGI